MIYLDNAATTAMDPEVIEVVGQSMRRDFANSGTVYRIGLDARNLVEKAREEIAESLELPANYRIIFTSGGSESNNLFIKGKRGPRSGSSGPGTPKRCGASGRFKKVWRAERLPGSVSKKWTAGRRRDSRFGGARGQVALPFPCEQ